MPTARDNLRELTRTRRASRASGFTILEVMMAAAIMVFAISTSLATMQSAFLTLDTARNVTLAGQVMVTEMEKMRMCDWATVDLYTKNSPAAVTVDPAFTNNPKIANRFTLTRTVSTVGGNANLLQLTYTIAWNSYNRRPLSRSYTSYYSRYGIHDYLLNTL